MQQASNRRATDENSEAISVAAGEPLVRSGDNISDVEVEDGGGAPRSQGFMASRACTKPQLPLFSETQQQRRLIERVGGH